MFKKVSALLLAALLASQTVVYAQGNKRILDKLSSSSGDFSTEEIAENENMTSDVIAIVKEATDKYLKSIPNVVSYKHLGGKTYVFSFKDVKTALIMAEYLRSDPNIEDAEVDSYFEFNDDNSLTDSDTENQTGNDADVSSAGENDLKDLSSLPDDYSKYSGQWYLDEVNASGAWEALANEATLSNSAVVAVIDTGLDITNTDIKNRVLKDANGKMVTYNAVTGSENPSDIAHMGNSSNSDHGTKVASIIAAQANNNYGICGVAGETNVSILPINVMNRLNSISQQYLCSAMEYAISKKVDVINISLSSPTNLLADYVKRAYDAGITVVCAAGNYYSTKYSYPATSFYSLSVGATSPKKERSVFSQYNDMVDISAPGESMSVISENGVVQGSGTSFASPVVAAIAAMVKISNPDITPKEMFDVLKLSATDLGSQDYDIEFGYGLVNAQKAVSTSKNGHVEVKSFTYPKSHDLKVNSSYKIETSLTPVNADNKTIKYFSSDKSVATVSANGVVHAINPGRTYISIILEDRYDLSFDADGNNLMQCYIDVYPDSIDFAKTNATIGEGTVLSPPNTSYDKFYLLGENSLYRVRINESGGTGCQKIKTFNSQYKFVEYLPKNAGTERENLTYVMASDSGNIIVSKNEDFSSAKQYTKPDYWNNANKYIAVASDGASFTLLDNNGYFHNYNVYDDAHTKNTLTRYQLKNTYNDIKYVADENSYMYVAVGYTADNKCVIGYSEYGSSSWTEITVANLPVFKQILVDGQYCYLLSDDAVYATKAYRTYNSETNTSTMHVAMPKKYYDIDSSKVTKIASFTDAGANVAVGFGGDNNVYALSNGGTEVVCSFDGKKVDSLFAFNNTCWAIVDGVLMKGSFTPAESQSITSKLKIYDIDILDSNKNLVESVPTNGKFYTEYYMECVENIEFEHEKSTSDSYVLNNKYPVQIITAVYEKDTNKLVSVKKKNFIIEYGTEGSMFKWIEQFNLNSGNYYVKTLTLKGNNFYWPEKNNSGNTLDVFAKYLEK